MKVAIGFFLALSIGVFCRLTGIPVPAPQALVGALLVVAMTSGYLLVGRYASHRSANHEQLCAGPTGTGHEADRKL
jgi:XapX domain-containing protein